MSTHIINFPGADINTTQLTVGTGGLNVDNGTLIVNTQTSKVGIGSATPGYSLDVVGDVNYTGRILKNGVEATISSPWNVETSPDALSYTSGNVGIGAANPDATLQVTGNVYISSNLEVGTGNLVVDTTTSNVGIGTTTPQYSLDVVGDINFSGGFYQGGSPFISTPWTIETGPDALSYTAGNVGIGAANPDATLQVTGNTYISSNLEVGTGNLFVDTTSSNVGIGSTIPEYSLDVVGDINFSGDLYQGKTLFVSTPWTIETGPDALSYTSGNVGIGAANPDATLQVTGNVHVSSNLNVVSNVFIAGGLVTNTGGVTKKTYSQTGTITTGTAPNIDIVFSNHAFSAKITAQLIESDIEISTLNIDVTGGKRGGASTSTLNIAKGPLSIFGDATSNPWSTTVGATTTTVTLTPSTNLNGTGYYNIFVEYVSADAGGSVSTIGGTSTGY
jgi:hypothetical protein